MKEKPNLTVIVPCGNECEETLTLKSIDRSDLSSAFDITVHVVHNHMSRIQDHSIKFTKFTLIQSELTQVSSVSTARNYGLDQINFSKDSYLLFLDAGDMLMEETSTNHLIYPFDLYHFDTIIQSNKMKRYLRKNRFPVKIIRNPFYLGSVILNAKLAKSIRFHEGRREDWKFWYMILNQKSLIVRYVPSPIYVYTIKSRSNHLFRKAKNIQSQYKFYRVFLLYSMTKSIIYLWLHYLSAITEWATLKKQIRNDL